MPIINERFVPSKKNYAINWDSFTITDNRELTPGNFVVSAFADAIWATKKKGVSYISKGVLHSTFYMLPFNHNFGIKEFCEKFDSRYGGDHVCVWDGEIMTTKSPIPLQKMVEYSQILDPVIENLPNVPQGYEGWYRLK